jgi:GNAT superfamily N-acetyltransferase
VTAAASAGGLIVRPATAADLTDVHGVLARSGLRSGQPEALDFYLTSPGGRIVVACQQDRVTGTAYSVSFGRTGWLGNVAVDAEARGQGIGTAVSAAAIDWLRQAGVATVLLTATPLGRPVYERLGFTEDGVRYGIWQRDPPRGPSSPAGSGGKAGPGGGPGGVADVSRPDDGAAGSGAGPGGVAGVLRLDAEATGEDRGAYLRAFAVRARVPAEPGQSGYWLPLPWGGGPVVASCADAARALVIGMMQTDPEASLSFPEPNAGGASLAASLGFRLSRLVPRMRLGPPVSGFRPEQVFNVFSLAVG